MLALSPSRPPPAAVADVEIDLDSCASSRCASPSASVATLLRALEDPDAGSAAHLADLIGQVYARGRGAAETETDKEGLRALVGRRALPALLALLCHRSDAVTEVRPRPHGPSCEIGRQREERGRKERERDGEMEREMGNGRVQILFLFCSSTQFFSPSAFLLLCAAPSRPLPH